jgi:hypothetical protein
MPLLAQRAITVVITAGPKSESNPNPITFGPNKQNTLTLAGYRVSAVIDYPGGASSVSAQISVYGMNLSDMNTLASLGQPQYRNNLNQVSILAGDAENGMSLVFQGTLQAAIPNFSAAPRVGFDMTAFGFYDIMMTPVPPASFGGAANVATIMASFAANAGLGFENSGVSVVLSNPYFPGTLGQQIKACARAANINFILDPTKGPTGTLAIWPKNGVRSGTVGSIGPQTGMIGYPRYAIYGIDVDMLFNPNLVFGGQLKVASSLGPANGTWAIYQITHQIESLTPGGDWLTTVSCWSPQNFLGGAS